MRCFLAKAAALLLPAIVLSLVIPGDELPCAGNCKTTGLGSSVEKGILDLPEVCFS